MTRVTVGTACAIGLAGVLTFVQAQSLPRAQSASAPIVPAAASASPSAPPTFKAGVELVSVDVSVLDKNRQPVRGLSASDFTVLEDGKPRPVAAFTSVDLPAPEMPSAPWMQTVTADVTTNVLPQEGRLVVILMDRTIRVGQQPLARAIATAVVNALRPGDLAAIVYIDRGTPQDFTDDRARLLQTIQRPFVGVPEADSDSDNESGQTRDADSSAATGQCVCGTCSLERITEIANGLSTVPRRRKLLFFIGTNIPVETSSPMCETRVDNARKDLLRAAGVANLTIDVFDPSGIETLLANAEQRSAPSSRSSAAGLLDRQGNLGVYPGETGGRTVLNTNDPAAAVPAVFDETHAYYVLGFPPADARADGKYHEIKVKVARKNVTVASRRGFYAPGAKAPAITPVPGMPTAVVQAISGLWPATTYPLSVSTASFAPTGTERTPAVAVIVNAAVPNYPDGTRRPLSGARDVTVLAGAFDPHGRSFDVEHATLKLPAGADHYEVTFALALKPGRYEIRVAADDASLGLTGSVYAYADVPDFSKRGLTASGVLLHAEPALLAARNSPLGSVVPFVPTAQRTFARTDRVSCFVRLYQGGQDPLRPATVTSTVVDESNRTVFERAEPVAADAFGADRAADVRLDLPLATLAPGEYLLTLDIAQGNEHQVRDVRFTVK